MKKDKAKEKARNTTALVTTGTEILKRLEQLGASELLRLKIVELYALIANGDPQGSIHMKNKKKGQEKANLMSTVQVTLRRFFAVASVQAPPLLQIPLALVICEEENTLNLQIEGLPAFFLYISDPVFPYATEC